MTSIVIWINRHEDEYLPGLWAVSDSRISASSNVLTDHFQKLTILSGYAYATGDFYRRHPKPVFTAGIACAASTLISSAIREFMTSIVSDLQEIEYMDAPGMPFDDKLPSLEDIAQLTVQVARHYVLDLGQHYPKNAHIEIALYGFCVRTGALRLFKVCNTPASPAEVTYVEITLVPDTFCIMGDKTQEVEHAIQARRATTEAGSLAHSRAPIAAVSDIVCNEAFATIGGPLQLCVAGRFGVRNLPLSPPGPPQQRFAGIDLLQSGTRIGGFSYLRSMGLSFPWPPLQRSDRGR